MADFLKHIKYVGSWKSEISTRFVVGNLLFATINGGHIPAKENIALPEGCSLNGWREASPTESEPVYIIWSYNEGFMFSSTDELKQFKDKIGSIPENQTLREYIDSIIVQLKKPAFNFIKQIGNIISVDANKLYQSEGKIGVTGDSITFSPVAKTGKAKDVTIDNDNNNFTSSNVEDALDEVKTIADSAVQTITRGSNTFNIVEVTRIDNNVTVGLNKPVATSSSATTDNYILATKGYVDDQIVKNSSRTTLSAVEVTGSGDTCHNFIKVEDVSDSSGQHHDYHIDVVLAELANHSEQTSTGLATDAYVKDALVWETL